MKRFNRRDFLRLSLTTAAGAALAGCSTAQPNPTATPAENATRPQPAPTLVPSPQASPLASATASERPASTATAQPPNPTGTPALAQTIPAPASGQPHMAVARGSDPEAITRAALKALGGMERFVKKGNSVILKPNICTDYYTPEYAATTNPFVVAALVKLCLEAGAKRVRVMDMPFGGTPESAYKKSGIAAAVKAAGGEMELMSPVKFVKTAIPNGKQIKNWNVYRDALEADVLINIPIAKNHSLAVLTLSIKNLFGLASDPGMLHSNLGQRAADLLSLFKPALTVIDAVRILTDHGPTGGSLDDVKLTNTVIASHDAVSADAYATSLFGYKPADIAYITAAAAMGLGTLDLKDIQIEEIHV
jgi:uncharacterized protein (DUF362 family)